MTIILAISLVSLPNPRVLFSQTFGEGQSLEPLIPELITKLQNVNSKGFMLKLRGNIRVFIAVSVTKTAILMRIKEDCEVPLGLLEEFAGKMIVEFETNGENPDELRYNFAKKRDLRTKFEVFVKEFEAKAEKAPGFERINQEINQINFEMQRNIDKMLIQQENLIKIEQKTEKMAELASKFKEKATELKVQETGGDCPMGFRVFMGALLAIIFAVVIIIVAYYSDNEYTDDTTSTLTNSTNSSNSSVITATQHFIAFKNLDFT